ncbi:unnamed protein product [Caenorhabditis sp. 36 PRJEB53466]|nr:unnamed protein product [Caenorhabditis sp. 36 PRJEB53466]
MERDLRLKAFMEEYARIVQLFEDIVSMKESMGRLEKYMIIMVCQVLVALVGGAIFMCIRQPIRSSTRIPSRSGYEPIGEPTEEAEEQEEEKGGREGSVPSLVSGPSTFLHFTASPAPSYTFRDENSCSDGDISENEDPTLTPSNWRNSSPTLSVSTPILAPRRSYSFSSIPTIDRTISEDSMLVIKRL